MKNLLILLITTVITSLSCSRNSSDMSTLRIMDGYILRDSVKNQFYLQDMESASLVLLDFINDNVKDLSFEDFGHVEVIGQYNQRCKCLIVEQILPTKELIVLEPFS